MRSPRTLFLLGSLAALPLVAGCPVHTPAKPPMTGPSETDTTPSQPQTADPRSDAEFLELYATTRRFSAGMPVGVQLTPDGKEVFFLRSEAGSLRRDLFSFDVASAEERVVLRSQDLVESEGPLPAEEKARRERQRMIAGGIGRFQLSGDGRFILAPLSGKLFVVERATGAITKLESEAGWPLDPRFSPDASRLSFIVDHDVYVMDVKSGEETRLTTREADHIRHGEAEFVAQEEMGRHRGLWWSPDGKHIAYQRTDVSKVEVLHIADPSRPEKEPVSWPYPRVGTDNADVRLGIMPSTGGATVWVDWDRQAYPYMARVVWSKNAPLTVLVQNREQTEELLLAVDTATGKTRTLLTERDAAWLNIDRNMPIWLKDGQHFLWTTERAGSWQLELRGADGSLVRTLTGTDFPYRDLAHVDEISRAVYVSGNALDDPTQQQIYRLSLDDPGPPAAITEGKGVHRAQFARDGSVYVHTFVTMAGPTHTRVMSADGQEIGELASNAPAPPFEPNVEITSIDIEGRTHWAYLVRPNNFDATRKYPVLVRVYGGPRHPVVAATARRYLREQWTAEHGFVVVGIDGRGTPNRGRAWERVVKGDLATVPLDDQVKGLEALGARYRELDLDRVGIYGWSFGGYMSAMAVMRRPDVFRVGIAGAPVTDWHDYDTHYTERYMGLADKNPDGYDKANVLRYAAGLERPLMIIHGTGDDNVYVVHSMKLVTELTRAGKPYIFIPLIGSTHMVADPRMGIRLEQRYMRFFMDHLQDTGE